MFKLLANRLSSETLVCLELILFCLILRLGVVGLRLSELNEDPDSYIGIAQNLITGRGYSIPGTTQPTAFRPPFYPLLIAPISSSDLAWARGLLNIMAAGGGMVFVWLAAKNLGLGHIAQYLAILVYGCDPLLLRYTSLSMTETICSMLAAMLIWRLSIHPDESSLKSRFITGILFGLCTLTRPTFWAFGMLYSAFIVVRWLTSRTKTTLPTFRQFIVMFVGSLLTTSPWFIRNVIVLESPVLMTSHGGYTILLGNNEAFYREVIEQPFGTVWDGSKGAGQAVWANNVNQEMDKLGLNTEVERDHWMSELAKQTIRENPVLFFKACLLRLVRFWNLFPSGPAMENVSAPVYWAVGVWYVVIGISFFSGIFQAFTHRLSFDPGWSACLLLILSFMSVHLIYWSNVRMRAPIVPAIALFAAASYQGFRINESVSLGESESLHST